MINLKLQSKEKAKQEINQEKQQEQRLEFQRSVTPYDGHDLFEIDVSTMRIRKARFEKRDFVYDPNWKKGKKLSVDSTVITNIGCVYVAALNKENAIEKYNKNKTGDRYNDEIDFLKLNKTT
ncbi:MAG: hypothetical protein ACI9N9_000044 [Enterobacterales bacterium]|jgi:hypothetical protein